MKSSAHAELSILAREAHLATIPMENPVVGVIKPPARQSEQMNSNEKNAARIWELARLLAITGGCEGCNLRGLHSCQNLVSRQLCWIKKADELIKRRKAEEEGR